MTCPFCGAPSPAIAAKAAKAVRDKAVRAKLLGTMPPEAVQALEEIAEEFEHGG